MKKLVLVVAMFMFVCGGSFLVKAQNSAEAATALAEVNATAIVNDTVVKDTVTKSEEPVKTELSAPTAIVNDTVVTDTASKDKPAAPVKEYPFQKLTEHSLPNNSKHTTKKAIPTSSIPGMAFLFSYFP